MMKRILIMAGLATAMVFVANVQCEEVLRLNFDEEAVEKTPIPYLGGPTDLIPEGVVIDLDDPTNGRPQECGDSQGVDCEEPFIDVSEPEIFEPEEAGIQGGNVLFLDQEDTENPQGEGLYVSGLGPLTEAWTVEVVFRTFDPLLAPAEYNIQNIIGTENAPDPTLKFQLRIFGDGLNGLGVPASGQIQSGDLSGGSGFGGPDLEAFVWVHAAMVYDGAGALTGYLDGEEFGSSSVTTGMQLDQFAIGYYMSSNDTPNQSIRGLWGEIDAVSISDEVLTGATFRLLNDTSVDSFSIY